MTIYKWKDINSNTTTNNSWNSTGDNKTLDSAGGFDTPNVVGLKGRMEIFENTLLIKEEYSVISRNLNTTDLPIKEFTIGIHIKIDSFGQSTQWGGAVTYFQDNAQSEWGWLLGWYNKKFCFTVSTEDNPYLSETTSGKYMSSEDEIKLHKWYRLVGVYNGSETKLYVDGVQKQISYKTGNIKYPPSNVNDSTHPNYYKTQFTIGSYIDINEDFRYKGAVKEVVILDEAKDLSYINNELLGEFPCYSIKSVINEEGPEFGNREFMGGEFTNSNEILFFFEFSGEVLNFTKADIKITGEKYGILNNDNIIHEFVKIEDNSYKVYVRGLFDDTYAITINEEYIEFIFTKYTSESILQLCTPIEVISNNITPKIIVSSSKIANIHSDSSLYDKISHNSIIKGINSISFNELEPGIYENEWITVVDSDGKISERFIIPKFEINITPPIIVISSYDILSGETSNDRGINLTFTSSKDTANFNINSITITDGAKLENFYGRGKIFTALFIPDPNKSSFTNKITVDIGAFSDILGNTNTFPSNVFIWIHTQCITCEENNMDTNINHQYTLNHSDFDYILLNTEFNYNHQCYLDIFSTMPPGIILLSYLSVSIKKRTFKSYIINNCPISDLNPERSIGYWDDLNEISIITSGNNIFDLTDIINSFPQNVKIFGWKTFNNCSSIEDFNFTELKNKLELSLNYRYNTEIYNVFSSDYIFNKTEITDNAIRFENDCVFNPNNYPIIFSWIILTNGVYTFDSYTLDINTPNNFTENFIVCEITTSSFTINITNVEILGMKLLIPPYYSIHSNFFLERLSNDIIVSYINSNSNLTALNYSTTNMSSSLIDNSYMCLFSNSFIFSWITEISNKLMKHAIYCKVSLNNSLIKYEIIEYLPITGSSAQIDFTSLLDDKNCSKTGISPQILYEYIVSNTNINNKVDFIGWVGLLENTDIFKDIYANNLYESLFNLYTDTEYNLPVNDKIYISKKDLTNPIKLIIDISLPLLITWLSITNTGLPQTETVYFNHTSGLIKYWINDNIINNVPGEIISEFQKIDNDYKFILLKTLNLNTIAYINLKCHYENEVINIFRDLVVNDVIDKYNNSQFEEYSDGIFIFKFNDTYTNNKDECGNFYIPIENGNSITITDIIYNVCLKNIWVYYKYNAIYSGELNNNDGFKLNSHTLDIEVIQWGGINLSKIGNQFENFKGCITAIDSPIIKPGTSLEQCFKNSYNFIDSSDNLNTWDTKNVISMREMFYNARCFNSHLNNWNVENVLSMEKMFYNAREFNSNIDTWNVKSITIKTSMFENAILFNKKLVKNTGEIKNFDWGLIKNNTLDWNIDKGVHMLNNNISKNMFKNAVLFKNGYTNSLILTTDTLIKIDEYNEPVKVQNLHPGLHVFSRHYKINNISSEVINCPNLIKINKHSLDGCIPTRDLIVNSNLMIYLDKDLYNISDLADDVLYTGVYRILTDKYIKMYCVFLERKGRLISGELEIAGLKCISANPFDYDYSRFNNLLKFKRTI